MRVLILSFYYYPDLCAGSFRATAFVEKLMEEFPAETEFHVLTTMPNRYKSYRKSALEVERQGNVLIKRIPLPSHKSGFLDQAFSFFSYSINVLNFIHGKSYDAMFSTSSRLMTAYLGAIISKYKNIPLYLDVRDLFVDTLNDVFSPCKNFILLPIFKKIEGFSFRQAKKINIVSGGFKGYFDSRYLGVPLTVISNGIDMTFLEDPNGTYHSLPDSLGKRKVVYAGNIGEGQGLNKVIPKLSKLLKESHHFYFIGDGGRKKALEDELRKEDSQNVTLLPPVHRDQLKSYYSQADVLFLHLNSHKAFEKVLPSKIFEYSVYRKPIWAGVSGFSADFLKSEVQGSYVFKPCNVNEAVSLVNSFNYELEKRDGFISKYSRSSLMAELSRDFLNFCREHSS